MVTARSVQNKHPKARHTCPHRLTFFCVLCSSCRCCWSTCNIRRERDIKHAVSSPTERRQPSSAYLVCTQTHTQLLFGRIVLLLRAAATRVGTYDGNGQRTLSRRLPGLTEGGGGIAQNKTNEHTEFRIWRCQKLPVVRLFGAISKHLHHQRRLGEIESHCANSYAHRWFCRGSD